MAKVKVHAANFQYNEISISGSCLFIKTGVFQLSGDTYHASKIISLDVASEESVKKIGGSIGWGVVGGVVLGPVGAIAGLILGGKKNETTFILELDDNKKLMGTTDSKSFISLKGAFMEAEMHRETMAKLTKL